LVPGLTIVGAVDSNRIAFSCSTAVLLIIAINRVEIEVERVRKELRNK
jgi:hypothetical protein